MEDGKYRKFHVLTTVFVLWTILSSSDVLVRGQNNSTNSEVLDTTTKASNVPGDDATGDGYTAQSSNNTIEETSKVVTNNDTTATAESSANVTNADAAPSAASANASENAAQDDEEAGRSAGETDTSQNVTTSPLSNNQTDVSGGADVTANETTKDITAASENFTSPIEDVTSPIENVTSPAENVTTSPSSNNQTDVSGGADNGSVKDVITASENVTSPIENVTSPTENVTNPAENATVPTEHVALPTESSTSSAENATIPTEGVAENTTTERENVTSPVANVTTEMTNGTSPTENVTAPETTSEPTPSPTPDGDRNVTIDSESPTITSTESTNVTSEAIHSTTTSQPQSVTNTAIGIDEHVVRPGLEKADFVVLDPSSNKPCLLASLNITFHFKYRVQEGLIRETYDTVSKQSANDDSSFTGVCQDSVATLSISWNNNTFTLNLTFFLHTEDSTDGIEMDVLPRSQQLPANATWSLHQVVLSYDTANQNIFPGALNPSQQTVPADNLNLFKTPYGMSYMCQTPEAVSIQFKDVDLVFNFVHLLPFGVETSYFTNDTVVCSGDWSAAPSQQESLTIPLIVAAVLAAVVVVIILGYAIQRVVTRHLRQSAYKQME